MTDDLVTQARTSHREHTTHGAFIQRLADRIEAQEAEIVRLREKLEKVDAILAGEIVHEVYVHWPWWGPGNRHKDSELAQFAAGARAALARIREVMK